MIRRIRHHHEVHARRSAVFGVPRASRFLERAPTVGLRPARNVGEDMIEQFDDGLKQLLDSGEYLRILRTPVR